MNPENSSVIQLIGFLLLLAIAFTIYFLPSFLAKKESPQWGVFIVNLLFGWTIMTKSFRFRWW